MGVFSGHAGMAETSDSPKECKRDYEREIATLKKRQERTGMLLSAIEDYIDGEYVPDRETFSFGQLVGALYLEQKRYAKTIDTVMAEWEKNK